MTSTATTAADGTFTLADVPIGIYATRASKQGYTSAVVPAVGVAAGLVTQVAVTVDKPPPTGPGSVTGGVLSGVRAGDALVAAGRGKRNDDSRDHVWGRRSHARNRLSGLAASCHE